jgi:hypothetical protein
MDLLFTRDMVDHFADSLTVMSRVASMSAWHSVRLSNRLRWNDRQRAVLIDKLGDAANVAAGGLLVGQLLGASSLAAAASGLGVWAVLLALCMFLARGGSK